MRVGILRQMTVAVCAAVVVDLPSPVYGEGAFLTGMRKW